MRNSQVVVKVGAEGGEITLSRGVQNGRWEFLVTVGEAALDQAPYDRGGGSDISEALKTMDRYPWHRLYPVEVHPDFAETIYAAVEARGGPEAVQRWKEILETHR